MSTITKERVAQYANDPRMCNVNDEIRQIARIALASIEAEPVGFIARHKETGKFGSYLHPKADWFKNDDYEVLSAYTAPPAPVSDSLLSELLGIAKRAADEADECAHAEFSDDAMKHSAAIADWERRAAMLQGADGNSPDGWVACSERMPKKGQEVLCTDRFENYETALYDTGYIPRPPFFATTAGEFHPTHWMPLPPAPAK